MHDRIQRLVQERLQAQGVGCLKVPRIGFPPDFGQQGIG
jgi:hypothetical protein